MPENLRDTIEEVCSGVLKKMNLSEDQMWETSKRLSEYMMSEKSKTELEKVKAFAKDRAPEDLEKIYHKIFLLGYNSGVADEQRRRR
jgi:predicted metal-binding transcription factor (methanogenesis marker protein 9)